MPSPQGQPYVTVQELTTFGLSAQFLASPLLQNPAVALGWAALQSYAENAQIIAVAIPDGNYYAAQGGGISGAVEPTWPQGLGETVLDGSVTWQNMGVNTVANVAAWGASEMADAYLRPRVKLPLVSYGYDLKRLVAHVLSYDLAVIRGFKPDNPAEAIFETRAATAMKVLRDYATRHGPDLDVVGQTSDAPGGSDPSTGPGVVSPNYPANLMQPEAFGTRGTRWR